MRDPLDIFGDMPDFPGVRPPKNRAVAEKNPESDVADRFNGAKGKKYIINGEPMMLYTVGQLAKALNRQAQTIRIWEYEGIIPKPSYRTPAPKSKQLPNVEPKGRRLYSFAQVDFLVDACVRFDIDSRLNSRWDEFKQHIKQNWPN
jgi:hypothetical protein